MPKQGLFGSKRPKYIHSVGAVAKCRLVVDPNSPFTGIYKQADHGLVRFSSAVEPSKSQALAPGIGLKFLRDNADSANLVAMFGVDGTPGTWNIFAKEFKNWIGAPSGTATKILAKKFSEATDLIQTVGLSNWGQVDQTGNAVANPQFPF